MPSLMEIISFTAIILIINSLAATADQRVGPKETRGHTALRRLDCQLFCKKTGFSGIVGGCQCGFTLFSRKRSDPNANDNIGYETHNSRPASVDSDSSEQQYNSRPQYYGPNSIPRGISHYSNDRYMKNHFLLPFTSRPFGHI